jgi:hypothetical protein
MLQLLAHLWGNYLLQSEWMAQNKTKRNWPCLVHCALYSALFIPLCWKPGWVSVSQPAGVYAWSNTFHWNALGMIFATHYLIDRYRLARCVVWVKNWMGPKRCWCRHSIGGQPAWTDDIKYIGEDFKVDDFYIWYAPTPPLWGCPSGYPPTTPVWFSTWLLIIADNTLHLTINYLALRYL